MLVTLPNIEKITIYIVTFKGYGHPKLTVSSSCYKFSKLQTSPRYYFLIFSRILGRIVADKTIVDLRKFYCKITKGFWDILGQTWHEMKKREKWSTFVASVTHDISENLRWKNFHIFIMIWKVYHKRFMNDSQCLHREKIRRSLCKKLRILCNTEVLIFTIFR